MSLASAIIADAAEAVGLGSSVQPVDVTITDRALFSLQSLLEDWRLRGFILTGLDAADPQVSTTIVFPALSSTEMAEPAAAREHIVNALSVWMIPYGRIPISELKIPKLGTTEKIIARLYRDHTIPNLVPSKLLHRGQGSRQVRVSGGFFDGSSLADDVS